MFVVKSSVIQIYGLAFGKQRKQSLISFILGIRL